MAADRQTPIDDEVFLDHVGWFVPDIESAASTFQNLGFVLTPFIAHKHVGPHGPELTGTGNRCAMLRRGYLEVLTSNPAIDTPLVQTHRAALSRHTGVHLLAFSVSDADTVHSRLSEDGFQPTEPLRLRRPIGKDEAAFTVVRASRSTMPEGQIQFLTQETPDVVWQRSLINQNNGIDALAGVILCVSDTSEAADRYSRFLNRPAVDTGSYTRIQLDRGFIALTSPDQLATLLPSSNVHAPPFFAAVILTSADLAKTRAFWTDRRIPLRIDWPGVLCVDPQNALGAALVVNASPELWP